MTAYRTRKNELSNRSHLRGFKKDACVFCEIKKGSEQLKKETKNFKVMINLFPYSLWDNLIVEDHLMVVPKKHTNTLASLSDKEKVEYVNIISGYEKNGYNIYARAPDSKAKSVIHQHTHLIKTRGTPKKFVLMLRKPYFRIFF